MTLGSPAWQTSATPHPTSASYAPEEIQVPGALLWSTSLGGLMKKDETSSKYSF